jgi:hypothetical protein
MYYNDTKLDCINIQHKSLKSAIKKYGKEFIVSEYYTLPIELYNKLMKWCRKWFNVTDDKVNIDDNIFTISSHDLSSNIVNVLYVVLCSCGKHFKLVRNGVVFCIYNQPAINYTQLITNHLGIFTINNEPYQFIINEFESYIANLGDSYEELGQKVLINNSTPFRIMTQTDNGIKPLDAPIFYKHMIMCKCGRHPVLNWNGVDMPCISVPFTRSADTKTNFIVNNKILMVRNNYKYCYFTYTIINENGTSVSIKSCNSEEKYVPYYCINKIDSDVIFKSINYDTNI